MLKSILFAFALLALSTQAHAGGTVTTKGRCTFTEGKSGRMIFNRICRITAGIVGVNGAAFWQVEYTAKSKILVRLEANDEATLNGKPIRLNFLDEQKMIETLDEISADRYTFAQVEM